MFASAASLWRLLVPLLIVVLGRRARFLSLSGSVAALCVGSAVVLAGWDVTAMLVLFFLLGSVATKVKQKDKEAAMPYPETEAEANARKEAAANKTAPGAVSGATAAAAAPHAKRDGRDMWQVLATGLSPRAVPGHARGGLRAADARELHGHRVRAEGLCPAPGA